MIAVRQIAFALPADFNVLLVSAETEASRNMFRLKSEWTDGTQRFDTDGAALFGAFKGADLVGVGGVTPEHGLKEPAWRMRRCYVLPSARRRGFAKALAATTMARGLQYAPLLTCNARATAHAKPFWEAIGFHAIDWPNITHVYRKG